MLLEALRKYTGTVVFVSHDRYFIDNLATRVFHIEGGKLQDYPGNYEDYLWQKERREAGTMDSPAITNGPGPTATRGRAEPGNRAKKQNPLALRKMEKERDELEEQISRAEAEIANLELELGQFKSAEESIRVNALIEERRSLLKRMTERWEQVVDRLDREGSSAREPREAEIPSPELD